MTNSEDRPKSEVPEIDSSWQRVLDVVPAAVYTCDTKGEITYFNRSAKALWGRAPKLHDAGERYFGANQMHLADGTPMGREDCLTALALREGKESSGRGIMVKREDGSRIVGEAYAYPLRNDQGQIVGALTLIAEITTVRSEGPILEKGADSAEPYQSALPRDATLAIIEIAVSMLTCVKWESSSFN
jgi:PAS domain S-box-containing protein